MTKKIVFKSKEMHFIAMINSNKRDVGIVGHSTHVVVVPPHLDVTLVSPVFAPAILHQPVVAPQRCMRVRFIAVAHSQHCMVKARRSPKVTVLLAVDALTVELETLRAGVDGDADWSHPGHSRLQSRLVTLRDVNEAVFSGANVSGLGRALERFSPSVGVTLLINIT